MAATSNENNSRYVHASPEYNTSQNSRGSIDLNTTPPVLRGKARNKRFAKKKSEIDKVESEKATDYILSILNLVVDHVMVPPSPLEPDEFQWKLRQQNARWTNQNKQEIQNDDICKGEGEVQVPVIRIFGPVTRGQCSNSLPAHQEEKEEETLNQHEKQDRIEKKFQSGCLFVHGAFPYLLARPVDAGPEGSNRSWEEGQEQCNDKINWDDADSVSLILDDIHLKLEYALRSSMQSVNDDLMDNENGKKQEGSVTRFIRQITLASGRGFYTFCSGTTAPFLKIEYYDPSHRWRVKIMLERGLELPLEYHPPTLNDDLSKDKQREEFPQESENGRLPPLMFRCYEAHIPYTMQFFKDWNLAGLSHVKVGDGRFRNPLPRSCKMRFARSLEKLRREKKAVKEAKNEGIFLLSNTPDSFIWKERKAKLNEGLESMSVEANNVVPSKKVEMKKTIDKDNYVIDEFWTHKETSCDVEIDVHISNILNVLDVMTSLPNNSEEQRHEVHWRAVPSLREIWAEERKRMSVLLPAKDNFLSDNSESEVPFTLSVKKGSSVPGSRLACKGMKKLYQSSPGLESDYRRTMKDIICHHESLIEKIDSLYHEKHVKKTTEQKGSRLKPCSLLFQETSDRNACRKIGDAEVKHLSENFSFSNTPDNGVRVIEPVLNEKDGILQCHSGRVKDTTSYSQFPFSSQMTQEVLKEVEDDMDFNRGVDNCDILSLLDNLKFEGSQQSRIEGINPLTLTPYADNAEDDGYLDEEENMEEDELEMSLHIMATQSMVEDNEYRSDSEASIITGKPDRSIAPEKLGSSYTETNICRELTSSSRHDGFSISNSLDSCIMRSCEENNNKGFQESAGDPCSSQLGSSFIDLENDLQKGSKPQFYPILSTESSPQYDHRKCVFELKERPPLRLFFEKSGNKLYSSPVRMHPDFPKTESVDAPQWLGYSNSLHHSGLPSLEMKFGCGDYIEPVLQPPTRSQVKRWLRSKRLLKNVETLKVQQTKRRKHSDLPDGKTSYPKACQSQESIKSALKPFKSDNNVSLLEVKTPLKTLNHVRKQGDGALKENASIKPSSQKCSVETQTMTSHSLDNSSADNFSQEKNKRNGLKTPMPQIKSQLITQLTIMSIEVHVQCRKGRAGLNDSRQIAMKPDPSKDPVSAVSYVYACDPGSGEKISIIDCGCILVPTEGDLSSFTTKTEHSCNDNKSSNITQIGKIMGVSSKMKTEVVSNEIQLLLRLASVVQWKDPDVLMSWDTQGGGLGYLIERGLAVGKDTNGETTAMPLNMVRLFGRCPRLRGRNLKGTRTDSETLFCQNTSAGNRKENDSRKTDQSDSKWSGSALGTDWDERIGAGVGPSSIIGRLVLNACKIIAEEVKHPNASYQPAMVATVLKKRIPFHDDLLLTAWYGANKGRERWRVLQHRLVQTLATVFLIDALDVIGRAGEAARLSGVELAQSFPGIRGSQYKVEGVLLRALQSLWSDERGEKKGLQKVTQSLSWTSKESISQTQSPWKLRRNMGNKSSATRDEELNDRGYFFYSPSKNDCNQQEALECQAMTLEPKSGFYFDPVVVCDFTALYPSLVIAYNLCYSTCAGKLDYHSTRSEMGQRGRTTGRIGPFHYAELRTASVLKHHMKSLKKENGDVTIDRAYVCGNGAIFVSEDILKGVLPNVLDELLSTRAMLKKAASEYRRILPEPPSAVMRQLEARQLALKYVANVIYGYSSATFSGRSAMPLLADAIVECGRRTLTNAIVMANDWGRKKDGLWFGAEVVYGDTDSIFIKLPGRNIKEAFMFGKEFCDAVTASNPPPVKLKLEKVYEYCCLQTKKKYCGMKFESPAEERSSFEAKGIETIQKNQCAITQKILRNALITIFRSGKTHRVREYLNRQWGLIHAGQLPVSDFILTGRVRSQYRGGKIGPVQAALARRLAEADPGKIMRHKERLPYVIVASPGRHFKLRDCVLTPNELLLQWDAFAINSAYYARKHVNAALQRCFGLPPFNINVNQWYESCPKPQKRIHHWPITRVGQSAMISSYFGSDLCALCGLKCKADGSAKAVVCETCKDDKRESAFLAINTLNKVQQKANYLASICHQCNGCVENSGTYAMEKFSSNKKKSYTLSISVESKVKEAVSLGITSPIANCICIDCPVTYKRHEMRESEVEALVLCKALRVLD